MVDSECYTKTEVEVSLWLLIQMYWFAFLKCPAWKVSCFIKSVLTIFW